MTDTGNTSSQGQTSAVDAALSKFKWYADYTQAKLARAASLKDKPRTGNRIPLTHGLFATVDAADYPELSKFKWYAEYNKTSKSWYAFRSIKINGRGTTVSMGRQLLGLQRGDPLQCDHHNHDTID